VIAEVVEVNKPAHAGLDQRLQTHTALVGDGLGCFPLLIRDAVMPMRDLVLVQVAVGPAHCPLQDRVQLRERDRLGDEDASPDERRHTAQLDPELRPHRGERGYAASATDRWLATRHGSNSSMRLIGCVAMGSST